jgi:L-fuconolactonase
MVVDAHHHLWKYKPGFKPWMEGNEKLAPLRRDFLGRELKKLISENGIDKTVIIQAGDSLEDTAFMLDCAHSNKYFFAPPAIATAISIRA